MAAKSEGPVGPRKPVWPRLRPSGPADGNGGESSSGKGRPATGRANPRRGGDKKRTEHAADTDPGETNRLNTDERPAARPRETPVRPTPHANNSFAIVSDIHSNLEALEAVFADIDERGITDVVCLGDIVGYGANPKECLDLVRERCRVTLMGNHDHAVLFEPTNFNLPAERACYWSRQVLEDEPSAALRKARWKFLGELPIRIKEQDILFLHASPRRPMNEYIFPEDVFTNPQKVIANFERLDARICFVGHTHQPGVFVDDPYFDPPNELPDSPYYEVEEERAIVNVGSVGQPRDRDARAGYVVVHRRPEALEDGTESLVAAALSCSVEQVEFVRVEYDLEQTVKKILAEPALEDLLGTRLYDGR